MKRNGAEERTGVQRCVTKQEAKEITLILECHIH